MVLSASRGSAPACPLPTVRGASDAPYRVMRGLPPAETPAVTGAATSTDAPQCRQKCRPSWICSPQALQYCMTPPFGIERFLVRRNPRHAGGGEESPERRQTNGGRGRLLSPYG